MKVWRILDRVVAAYFVYYLAVGLLATLAIDHYCGKLYQAQTGRVLEYSHAGINPLTFSVSVYGARDKNPDGSTLWSADELTVNPSLWGTLSGAPFGKGIVLDEVRVRSFYVHVRKNKDGTWVFADILSHREEHAAAPEPAESSAPMSQNSLPGISIRKINFHAKFLGYSDWSRPEPFDANLEDINFELSNFSTLAEKGQPYHFLASDESGGELEWSGTVSLLGASSAGRLDLRRISLLPAYRYIKSDVNFELLSAWVELGGNYQVSWKNPEAVEYSIQQGRFALEKIKLTPDDDASSSLTLDSFAVNHIAVDSRLHAIYSPEATLNGFGGTVSILKEGKTNFNKMFAVKSGAEPADNNPVSKTDEKKDSANSTPWSFKLDTIKIENTAFYFNDYSITPNFSAFIKDFGGSVDNISTAGNARADFSLVGKVGEYAPVTLGGNVFPGSHPLVAQAAFDFKGIDLTSFTPYSGTFAGRKISKGLLSVSLDYKLKGGLIEGKNHVIVDQLTLGERVDSPRLIDLPLQLALALLTDKDGVIDLSVDVSGDANNPDFSVAKILFGAFKNLIIKAVTAPFRFLASLVGSDDDFEYIHFDEASAGLPLASQGVLDKLTSVLSKRPGIKIAIVGLYSDKDVRHYQAETLRLQPAMDHLTDTDIAQKNERFEKAVKRQYKKSFPEGQAESVPAMYDALVEAEPFPEAMLQKLAADRAMAVKYYLITLKQADPRQVFLYHDPVEEKAEAAKLIIDA